MEGIGEETDDGRDVKETCTGPDVLISVGIVLGPDVGLFVGRLVGCKDGSSVGRAVGLRVGVLEGELVGLIVGLLVGSLVITNSGGMSSLENDARKFQANRVVSTLVTDANGGGGNASGAPWYGI